MNTFGKPVFWLEQSKFEEQTCVAACVMQQPLYYICHSVYKKSALASEAGISLSTGQLEASIGANGPPFFAGAN